MPDAPSVGFKNSTAALQYKKAKLLARNPNTHTHMPSHLPELPLEIQDIIIKYVLQLEERDKQRDAVAHLDGLLDDVVSLLGAQNNAEILHQWLELDIYDIVV